jgi:hypothetical protein
MALVATVLLIGPGTLPVGADAPPGTLGQARSLLAANQASQAIDVLEDALNTSDSAQQADLLELLRQAYAAAAREAEAAGRPSDAEHYRDNLQILNRKGAAPSHAAPARASAPAPAEALAPERPLPTPMPKPAAPPALLLPIPAPAPRPEPEPEPEPQPAPAPPAVDVATADAAFRDKHYEEAGRLYAELDRQGRLPAARRDHWAYCRWTAVVRRINARPRTPQEWADIDAEIQRIRALSPNHWYGEYLRNRAADRPSGARISRSGRLVIRGSAPEEPALRMAAAAPPQASAPAPPQAPAPAPAPASTPAPAGDGPVAWKVRETPSFRILHHDPELAEQAAAVAEAARDAQIRRWTGSPPKGPWTPRCDLYLYPTARTFSQMTGQPEASPGFSTMGMNGGRIIARRVNLRVDHPNLLKAILPHEVTHVVLADLFPSQQIPRWADEGMAVLSEPAGEQHSRAADLEKPLGNGQLFKLEHLMAMDYPEGKYWGLYYAQSVSLTKFLVEQGSPTQFIQFVQQSQRSGMEVELRRIYKIDGFAELQKRWLAYARDRAAETTASAADAEAKEAAATPRRE